MISDAVEMTSVSGMRLAAAGVSWDAVKVRRHLAVRAIERIAQPGAVAVDPSPAEPALYFFIRAGSAAGWDVPQTAALGLSSHVVLPPDHREAPPGPYWLISPERGLTSTSALRQALEQTMGCAPVQGDQRLPDVGVMRAAVVDPLGGDAVLPSWAVVQTLAHLYCGNITLLIHRVEELAARQPQDDARVRGALASVGEARRCAEEIEAIDLDGEVKRAQRLGDSVLALCDHCDSLGRLLMCLACDKLIKDDEESVPYVQVRPSGGATAPRRLHVRCANTVRLR
ncbi:DUF6415 family natural product biosynthesis protein [Streptomyces sp. NPDC001073]